VLFTIDIVSKQLYRKVIMSTLQFRVICYQTWLCPSYVFQKCT